MSRLKALLHVAPPSTRNTQQTSVQACKAVAQHTHTTQQPLLHVAHPSPCNTQHAALDEAFEERPTNDGTFEAIFDPAAEARRERVLAMLEKSPGIKYALVTDSEIDPQAVLLTLAIRDRATCELRIPREKYDPFLLMTLIDRHGGTIH